MGSTRIPGTRGEVRHTSPAEPVPRSPEGQPVPRPSGAQPRPFRAGPVKRGRPRSEDADRAILSAATELLAERGLGGMSMEEVAVRAGVGKATVYRRWPSRGALALDAHDHVRLMGLYGHARLIRRFQRKTHEEQLDALELNAVT